MHAAGIHRGECWPLVPRQLPLNLLWFVVGVLSTVPVLRVVLHLCWVVIFAVVVAELQASSHFSEPFASHKSGKCHGPSPGSAVAAAPLVGALPVTQSLQKSPRNGMIAAISDSRHSYESLSHFSEWCEPPSSQRQDLSRSCPLSLFGVIVVSSTTSNRQQELQLHNNSAVVQQIYVHNDICRTFVIILYYFVCDT